MRYRDEPKVPIAPLVRYIERHPELVASWASGGSHGQGTLGGGPDAGQQATWRRYSEAREAGYITFPMADRMCCLMGVHMSEVYGETYWSAAA